MGTDSSFSRLTIGIPVHNEEQSLPESYASLVEAINYLPKYVQVEVIYCLNGCTDQSEHILRHMTSASTRMDNFQIIESEPGKMNAQMAIVRNRQFKDAPVCFADADILMGRATLAALHNKLTTDSRCMVSYAHVEPHYDNKHNGNSSSFPDLLFSHYNYRKHQPPRNYFHGRTFMMRDAHPLEEMGIDLAERVERVRQIDPWYVNHLGLEKGPLIDDIYLSRVIVAEHGLDAIAEVPDARILFHPPTTVEDYFRVLERTRAEIKRLDLLYPEHAQIQQKHFRREFEDASLYMPEGERLKLRLLRELETAFLKRVDDALLSPRERTNQLAHAHWVRAGTTKQAFGLITDESFLTGDANQHIREGAQQPQTIADRPNGIHIGMLPNAGDRTNNGEGFHEPVADAVEQPPPSLLVHDDDGPEPRFH